MGRAPSCKLYGAHPKMAKKPRHLEMGRSHPEMGAMTHVETDGSHAEVGPHLETEGSHPEVEAMLSWTDPMLRWAPS